MSTNTEVASPAESARASATTSYHPLFDNVPDAISLQCKDGVTFKIRSTTLQDASGFFRDTLSLPQTTDTASESNCIIPIDEESSAIETIFCIITGKEFTPSKLKDMDDIESMYFISEKYDLALPLSIVRMVLWQAFLPKKTSSLAWHPTNTVRGYALACRAGWPELVVRGATVLLSRDISDPALAGPLARVSSTHLLAFMRIRDARKRAFADQLESNTFLNKTINCPTCTHPIHPHPWLELRLRLNREFEGDASGSFVENGDIETWPESLRAQAHACQSCGYVAYRWPLTIKNLTNIVENLPMPE